MVTALYWQQWPFSYSLYAAAQCVIWSVIAYNRSAGINFHLHRLFHKVITHRGIDTLRFVIVGLVFLMNMRSSFSFSKQNTEWPNTKLAPVTVLA